MTAFTMTEGDDLRLDIALVDDEGAAVDLTGAQEVRWVLAKTPRTTVLVEKLLSGGVAVADAAGGDITVTLARADTLGREGVFYQEVKVTDLLGKIRTGRMGAVTIKAGQ